MTAENSSVRQRRKPDGGLRSVFKERLSGATGWQFTPIETGAIVSGVPDAEYCAPGGISGWIEFKYILSPKGMVVGLRPAQVSWIDRRSRVGGRAFIAIQRKDELYLYSGIGVKELKRHGLESQLGLLYHGKGKWDWETIRTLLLLS
jgi:hypothetical protein